MNHATEDWWFGHIALVQQLERRSLAIDPTIRRISAREMVSSNVFRQRVTADVRAAARHLTYVGQANSLAGPIRVAIVFRCCPFLTPHPWLDDLLHRRGSRAVEEPVVLALNGPTASPHRFNDSGKPEEGGGDRLCLYYAKDPWERRWRPNLGLVALFDMARVHLDAEHIWRLTGKWPIDEAGHGDVRPSSPNRKLLIQPSQIFSARAA